MNQDLLKNQHERGKKKGQKGLLKKGKFVPFMGHINRVAKGKDR